MSERGGVVRSGTESIDGFTWQSRGSKNMRRIWVALRAMFATLVGSVSADEMAGFLTHGSSAGGAEGTLSPPIAARDGANAGPNVFKEPHDAPGRSEAITLLAALQREARWVDLVQENLDGYSDSQVGAAARNVLRDCRVVLERVFALRAVVEQEEGSEVQTPQQIDAARWQMSGRVVGDPPYRGRLVHRGWEAGQVELPHWTGQRASARVVAPAEIEVG